MTIYIDPGYSAYYNNKLFDASCPVLNRDDTLAPYIRLKVALNCKNIEVKTADYLHSGMDNPSTCDYYSFGLLDEIDTVSKRKNVNLKAFVLFEPPVVAPKLYQYLPILTQLFEQVYVHNTIGEGYSLKGVDKNKLRKLNLPEPHDDVLELFWHVRKRKRRIVVINGNHKPLSFDSELYSKRIEVMKQFLQFDCIDLYGRNWAKWWSRESMWLPYWLNRKKLLSIYHGACDSKFEILSQYDFCLCFENMQMNGYVTEKLFDCFYAGTVPIYLGANDIAQLIPANTYIDFRQFQTILELRNYLYSLSEEDIQQYRVAARVFLQSEQGLKYYNALQEIVVQPI